MVETSTLVHMIIVYGYHISYYTRKFESYIQFKRIKMSYQNNWNEKQYTDTHGESQL